MSSQHQHKKSSGRKLGTMAAIAITSLGLIACAENPGPKQTGCTVVGAIAGGLLGSTIGGGSGKVVAIGIGALLGGIIGSEVGKSLDRADRLAMAQTTQTSLETSRSYTTSTWRNPDSGHSGTITPEPVYRTPRGEYCREYQQTVSIGGRTERAYGTACRQPDGSWRTDSG